MSYPATTQLQGSTFTPRDGIRTTTSKNGKTLVTDDYNGVLKGVFVLQHLVDDATLATHKSHYDTNKRSAFNMTWVVDSVVYSVIYTQRPKYTRHKDGRGSLWQLTTVMEIA
jgi:hypothetical protein